MKDRCGVVGCGWCDGRLEVGCSEWQPKWCAVMLDEEEV